MACELREAQDRGRQRIMCPVFLSSLAFAMGKAGGWVQYFSFVFFLEIY